MKMLRDWDGNSNEVILGVLIQFGIEANNIQVLKYEALTPDSFIWSFNVEVQKSQAAYYLYAEDFVESKERVIDAIKQNLSSWTPNDEIELVPVVNQVKWEEAEPVRRTDTYKEPENPSELMKYAAQSGYDFVFLARVIN